MYEQEHDPDMYLEPLRVRPGAWMWQGFLLGLAFVFGRIVGRNERGRVHNRYRR